VERRRGGYRRDMRRSESHVHAFEGLQQSTHEEGWRRRVARYATGPPAKLPAVLSGPASAPHEKPSAPHGSHRIWQTLHRSGNHVRASPGGAAVGCPCDYGLTSNELRRWAMY